MRADHDQRNDSDRIVVVHHAIATDHRVPNVADHVIEGTAEETTDTVIIAIEIEIVNVVALVTDIAEADRGIDTQKIQDAEAGMLYNDSEIL